MLLKRVNVDACCTIIYNKQFDNNAAPEDFIEYIKFLTDHYVKDQKMPMPPSVACASCEFITTAEEKETGLKSGFHECLERKFELYR